MNNREKTLLIIKPDGMKKNIIGKIINVFERNKLTIVDAKITKIRKKKAIEFYEEHKEKPFFKELIDFITSYKIMVIIIEGENSITMVRELIGSTNYKLAKPGTIRNKFGSGLTQNVVHASDSNTAAKKEIFAIFKKK
ncbi:MAG: nucleoside-diphosphate kinase [Enterobacteriaceae bacterium]|nr:nucleoside-diphosphate kinase [Enterobacteriaceae bacterium]